MDDPVVIIQRVARRMGGVERNPSISDGLHHKGTPTFYGLKPVKDRMRPCGLHPSYKPIGLAMYG